MGPDVSSGAGPRRTNCAARSVSPTRWVRSGARALRVGQGRLAPLPKARDGHPDALGPLAAASRPPGPARLARDAVFAAPRRRGRSAEPFRRTTGGASWGHRWSTSWSTPHARHPRLVDDMSARDLPPVLAAARAAAVSCGRSGRGPAPTRTGPRLLVRSRAHGDAGAGARVGPARARRRRATVGSGRSAPAGRCGWASGPPARRSEADRRG